MLYLTIGIWQIIDLILLGYFCNIISRVSTKSPQHPPQRHVLQRRYRHGCLAAMSLLVKYNLLHMTLTVTGSVWPDRLYTFLDRHGVTWRLYPSTSTLNWSILVIGVYTWYIHISQTLFLISKVNGSFILCF